MSNDELVKLKNQLNKALEDTKAPSKRNANIASNLNVIMPILVAYYVYTESFLQKFMFYIVSGFLLDQAIRFVWELNSKNNLDKTFDARHKQLEKVFLLEDCRPWKLTITPCRQITNAASWFLLSVGEPQPRDDFPRSKCIDMIESACRRFDILILTSSEDAGQLLISANNNFPVANMIAYLEQLVTQEKIMKTISDQFNQLFNNRNCPFDCGHHIN